MVKRLAVGGQPDFEDRRYRWPLRLRFAAGLAAVLLPFFVAAALGLFYLLPALLAPLESIISDVAEEMEPVRHVQVALLTAAVSDGRSFGRVEGGVRADPGEAGREVDDAFDKVRVSRSFDPGERALIEAAWLQWRAQDADLAPRAERAAEILDRVYVPARRELERSRIEAQGAKAKTIWATFGAFVLALLISVYASATLAGTVVAEVEGLRRGAVKLAGGDLSHRVAPGAVAEFSEMAIAFNAMAERIEKDQAALAELATRDGLTGLLNRREFLRLLREELDRSERYGHTCALLLVDIDRFKAVNDTWGHPAGDAVLRTVAERIAAALRPTDRAARYGGEEFAVLLPETPMEGALQAAERIRAAVGSAPVAVSPDRAAPVTLSAGVALYPDAGASEQALIAAADRALYAAKEGGRDRVVASTRAPTA